METLPTSVVLLKFNKYFNLLLTDGFAEAAFFRVAIGLLFLLFVTAGSGIILVWQFTDQICGTSFLVGLILLTGAFLLLELVICCCFTYSITVLPSSSSAAEDTG